MPANTPEYGFPYLLGSDPNDTIDTGFQNLALAIESFIDTPGVGKLIHLAGSDGTSTTQTTTSTSYVNKTDCQVTFTTGKSGIFIVMFSAVCGNSTTGITRASVDITGAVTAGGGANPNVTTQGTDRSGAGWAKFFAGTPNTSTTVTLTMSSSSGTGSVFNADIQVVNIG